MVLSLRLMALSLTLALGAGCNDNRTLGGSSSKAGDDQSSGDDQRDAEKDQANAPQQVNGAFLADCGDAGVSGYGCTLSDGATGQKIDPGTVKAVHVAVQYHEGDDDHPSPTMGAASDPWTFTFSISADKLANLKQIALTGSAIGKDLSRIVSAFKPYIAPVGQGSLLSNLLGTDIDVMFLSRLTYKPGTHTAADAHSFASAAEADAICDQLASANTSAVANNRPWSLKYPRTWFAILGDDTKNAKARVATIAALGGLEISMPVYSTAGKMVVPGNGWIGVGDYSTYNDLVITDEAGAYVGAGSSTWTGTDTSTGNCAGWSKGTADLKGSTGSPDLTQHWLNGGTASCDQAKHLYCFGRTQ